MLNRDTLTDVPLNQLDMVSLTTSEYVAPTLTADTTAFTVDTEVLTADMTQAP